MKKIRTKKDFLSRLARATLSITMSVLILLGSVTPAFTFQEKNTPIYEIKNKEKVNELYKAILNRPPLDSEIESLVKKTKSKSHLTNLDIISHLKNNVKNNLGLKADLISEAFKNTFKKDIYRGNALALAGTTLSEVNSYKEIKAFFEYYEKRTNKTNSEISYKNSKIINLEFPTIEKQGVHALNGLNISKLSSQIYLDGAPVNSDFAFDIIKVQDIEKEVTLKNPNENEKKKKKSKTKKKVKKSDTETSIVQPLSGEKAEQIEEQKKVVCENYIGCDFRNGFFCINLDDESSNEGRCLFVCDGGMVAEGLDVIGLSLPCGEGLTGSDFLDLSGRTVCCPKDKDKIKSESEDFKIDSRFSDLTGCDETSDCKAGEICVYTSPSIARCAQYNLSDDDYTIRKKKCFLSEIPLGKGPEGYFCYRAAGLSAFASSSSSGGSTSSSSGGSSSSSSGGTSSSSGGSSSSSGGTSSSSGGSSSSSGGYSSSSSSGGVKEKEEKKDDNKKKEKEEDFSVLIVLQTPEIFAPKLFGRNAGNVKSAPRKVPKKKSTLKAVKISSNTNVKKNTNIKKGKLMTAFQSSGGKSDRKENVVYHTYKEGETLKFSVFIKGPKGAVPKDISDYTVLAKLKEKHRNKLEDSGGGSILSAHIKPGDILSTSSFENLILNPPKLNACLVSENTKSHFTSAAGSVFTLQLPNLQYVTNASGGIQLVRDSSSILGTAPEDRCSKKGGNICGTKPPEVGNCVSYECWRYTKKSDLAKNCCKGLLPPRFTNDVSIKPPEPKKNKKPKTEAQKKKEAKSLKPKCDKKTKEITCSTTFEVRVPECLKGETPSCSEDKKPKPVCLLPASSSGKPTVSKDKPVCVSFKDSVNKYCKDISTLPFNEKFEVGRCVSDYCDYLKSPEDKKGCCAGCAAIYDTLTEEGSDDVDEEKVKSCIDFNGGYCKNFKHTQACVQESCYEKRKESEELKSCCISSDVDAIRRKKVLSDTKVVEERGAIYNIILINNNKKVKVKKSTEDVLIQNFDLKLPKDPEIGTIELSVAFKDKKNKTKKSTAYIGLVPDRQKDKEEEDSSEKDEKEKEKPKCTKPDLISLEVSDGGTIEVLKGDSIEIPIIATDIDGDIVSLDIKGVDSKFEIEELNSDPSYTFTEIKGVAKETGIQNIVATVADACKKGNQLSFKLVIKEDDEGSDELAEAKITESNKKPEAPNSDLQNEIIEKMLNKKVVSGAPVFKKLLSEILVFKGKALVGKDITDNNIIIAGSRIPIIINTETGGLDPNNLEVSGLFGNKPKTLPPDIEILRNGDIKLYVKTSIEDPEGKAQILISEKTGEKRIVAKADAFIIRPQEITTINKKIKFGPPIVSKHSFALEKDSKTKGKISITGADFLGKRIRIEKVKAIIPKNNSYMISSFTVAEFNNPEIKVDSIKVTDHNTKLDLDITLPFDYLGGEEELIISTPVGQTTMKIELPAVLKVNLNLPEIKTKKFKN